MRSVLILDPVHARGGMDQYCIPLATALKKHNLQVFIVTNSKRSDLSVKAEIVFLRYFGGLFDTHSKVKNLFSFVLGTLRTASFVIIKRPKAIHLHLFQYSFLELFLAALMNVSGCKVVATVHDVESFREGKKNNVMRSAVFALIRTFIVHNETSKSLLAQIVPHRMTDMHLIRHGNYIDVVSQFSTSVLLKESERKFKRSRCSFNILFFGQIKRVKAIEVLLDALQFLGDRNVDFSLSIEGKPSDYSVAQIINFIEIRGLKNKTHTKFEYLPISDAVTSIRSADVVVLPYQRIYQSGVLLFAMSVGAIVVASDLAAMLEVIEDGVNGFTFRSGDAKHLAEVLERVSGLPVDARLRVSAAAFRTARDRYSWDVIAVSTIEVYDLNEEIIHNS